MDDSTDQQVLMLAPADRAAVLASEVLASFGLLTRTCADIQTLCSELATASGAVLLTGEILTPDSAASLVDALKEQPAWSDLPLVVLTRGGESTETGRQLLELLGPRVNVTLLEWPARSVMLISALNMALRARRHQFEMRDLLAARAATEAALRESEERFRAIWESAADAIALSDQDGLVLAANPAYYKLYGYSPEETIGQSFALIFPVAERARAHQAYRAAFEATEIVPRFESVTRRADGREIVVEASYDFVVSAGRRVAMVSMVRDISERRALERTQQEFLTMVGHELRNPLAGIRGFAQLMARRQAYSAEAVNTIIAKVDSLNRLVGELIQASQIGSRRLALRRVECDLVAEARDSLEQARTLSDKHELRLETPSKSLWGWWDRDRVGQIFSNLLLNAIKYSPDGGEILVRVEDQGGQARVSICDQGIGIEAEALPKLFDRFYRFEAASGAAPGLGLGLHITKALVEAHGGQIEATSSAGQGSTLSFTLPYRSDEPAA
jgi:PAS domain S-box-containing protein